MKRIDVQSPMPDHSKELGVTRDDGSTEGVRLTPDFRQVSPLREAYLKKVSDFLQHRARDFPSSRQQSRQEHLLKAAPVIESISAVTLATRDMAAAVRFYRALGFEMRYGGEDATFTSFKTGASYLNLIAASSDQRWSWWGRVIFYVSDVDTLYAQAIAQGLPAETCPRDAEWGERYFHLTDPDGHELSFAKPLQAAVDRNKPTAK